MGLLTRYPYLKLYWDYEKNIGLNPKYIFPRSEIYVWWTCRLNHSVRMKVKSRVRFVDCRICEKMITPINGSLLELYPHIAKEWDYEKNYPLLPTAIKPKRRENVWWLCSEKQHSYFASPDNRVGKGSGCKRCASSRPRKRRR
ncbi:zinc-ribbon domain-containing protein [Paenibacillus sp. yr247]|uniref:zinc-ribbon domain-containing protein n=1 Tax=Paenibacillus sp. yr247 TaxID=1761880 RepID=UPI0034A19196